MAGDFDRNNLGPLSRRTLLRAGAGLAGGALLPSGLILPAFAEDQPALGTWPDGSKGDSVFVGDFRSAHRHLRRPRRGSASRVTSSRSTT